MKKHKTGRMLCSFLSIGIFIITGCRKKEEPFVYNNHIFTKEVVSEVMEIRYGGLGDEEYIIIDEKRIEKICRNLASLKLKKIPKGYEAYGSGCLTLITKKGEFSVGLLSHQIGIDWERYSTDKDATKYLYDDE